jgi:peptidylprolyl isomerase
LDEEHFTVDFNHPLAGKNLEFDLKVVGISDQPTQRTGCACSTPSGGGGCSC